MIGWYRALRRREHLALAVLACIALFLLLPHERYASGGLTIRRSQVPIKIDNADPLQIQHIEFWRAFYSIILNNDPQCEKKPDIAVPRDSRISFDAGHDYPRPDVMWMDDADLSRMKTAHSNFIKDIQLTTAKLAYNPNTRGITITASDQSLTTLTISVSMLRKTGSDLPVEVFLDKASTYTEDYCLNVLRPFNVKCRFLSDILVAGEAAIKPHSFQFKILAIIFSSFEDVLLLDADAWPVTQPEPLFTSSPFTDSGLVLWPDFWYPSESPYYFEIAKIDKIPPLNERPATESGMILYNKTKHAQSLMLAAYYNYYGPDYYYSLQSQGGQGEGDKETYVWAATALGEDFYFVKQGVRSLGRVDSSGEYVGTGMAQAHPVEDFYLNANTPVSKHVPVPLRPLFVHANFPKINPYVTFDKGDEEIHHPVQDQNGTWVRAWMPREVTVEMFGMDVEESLWETIRTVVCEVLQGVGLPSDTRDRRGMGVIRQRDQRICKMIDNYINIVFGKDNFERNTT